MEKVIRDGMVAVLLSPDYGAGWSTWSGDEVKNIMLFHPKLVEMVESGKRLDITSEWIEENIGITDHICVLGVEQLEVRWVKEGTSFRIDEYDGHESIFCGGGDMTTA